MNIIIIINNVYCKEQIHISKTRLEFGILKREGIHGADTDTPPCPSIIVISHNTIVYKIKYIYIYSNGYILYI